MHVWAWSREALGCTGSLRICTRYGTQPLLPPWPDFSELIMEALLGFTIQLISLPWKLAHQGLAYPSQVVLSIPLLLLSCCYNLSAFTGRLWKHWIEKNFLFSVPPVCSNTSGCHNGEASSRTSLFHANCASNLACLDEGRPRHPGLFE